MAKNNKDNYFSTLAKVAPAFTLKAVAGDLPKAGIEYATESKLRGSKEGLKELLKRGLRGRGAGRAAGAALGVATAPVFLKGLDYVSSKDKSKQRTGLALLGSTAATYQGQKGFIEGYRAARAAGTSKALSAKSGLLLGATRIGYKTPSAIALGLSIAKGRERSKGSKNPLTKFIAPALSGAAIGALSRGTENVVLHKGLTGGKLTSQVFKKALPAAGGGAAGGLVGGVVLSAAVDGALKALKGSKEKKAAAVSGGLLAAKSLASLLGIHAVTKGAMGYGKAGRVMSKLPGGTKLQRGMKKLKTRQLAIGIREGLAGRTNAGLRANVGLGMTVPELKFNREIGLKLGQLLRGIPAQYRPQALNFIKTRMVTPIMKRTKGGDPVPVFHQLDDAIDMATGKKKLFGRKGLSGAWNAALHGSRGAYTQQGAAVRGLPKALAQDAKTKGVMGDLLLSGGGIGGMAALMAGGVPAALVAPAVLGSSHAAMSGLKGLGVRTKYVQSKAGAAAAEGIRDAFLPGMRKSLGTKAGNMLLDYGVSPASRDFGKMVGAVARRGAEGTRKAFYGGAQGKINRLVSPKDITFSQAAKTPLMAAGTAAGLQKLLGD